MTQKGWWSHCSAHLSAYTTEKRWREDERRMELKQVKNVKLVWSNKTEAVSIFPLIVPPKFCYLGVLIKTLAIKKRKKKGKTQQIALIRCPWQRQWPSLISSHCALGGTTGRWLLTLFFHNLVGLIYLQKKLHYTHFLTALLLFTWAC